MHGFGTGRRRRRAATAPFTPAPTPVPIGATFGFVGDGIMSQAAAQGSRNMGDWLLALMAMRLQPVPVFNLAQSGTVIAQPVGSNANVWIDPTAIDALAAQKPDVAIFGTCGHNDTLMTTDPDVDPTFITLWKAALTRHVAANPSALLIPVMGTWPSAIGTETPTIRGKVWAMQAAHAASFADSRIVFVDVAGIDPGTANDPTDATRTHPDVDGGQTGGQLLYAAISPRVASATPAQIQALIEAGTYPLMGTQIDTDRALAGTAGTATTGMQAGSQIATSKLVSSTVAGATVAASMVGAGGYNKAVVTVSGTASASGIIMVQDKTALTLGATPGQYVLSGFGARIPAGLNKFGSDLSTYGQSMGGGSTADDAVSDNPTSIPIDTVWLTAALPTYGTSSPVAKRGLYLRYEAGQTLSGQLEVYQPFAWIVRDRLRHPPVYLGDIKPGGTGTVLATSNYRLRPTGTVSQAAGGIVRVDPGKWAPFGLTEADFVSRRIYAGGGAGGPDGKANLGAGTLVATLSGSNWTYAVAGGALATGTLLYVEIDAANGIGGTVTARSTVAVTVG